MTIAKFSTKLSSAAWWEISRLRSCATFVTMDCKARFNASRFFRALRNKITSSRFGAACSTEGSPDSLPATGSNDAMAPHSSRSLQPMPTCLTSTWARRGGGRLTLPVLFVPSCRG
eukprot:524238-Pyramimonas_sp.AAC.1